MTFWYCAVTFSMFCLMRSVRGHGRLVEPPSRSSMWRTGFNTNPNYNDNALNCGGYSNEWYSMQGKCGICGDPWQDPTPRNNEAGGLYGKGIITKTYSTGQHIKIVVQITANHGGWFEFRLCANNAPAKVITQSCLDRHLLQLSEGGTRHRLVGTESDVVVTAKLPAGLTCTQCVLQWKWNAGNSYGIDLNGNGCVGCGHQEEFYGCSDVAITATINTLRSTPAAITRPTIRQPQTVLPPVVTTTHRLPPQTSASVYTYPPKPSSVGPAITGCHGVNLWRGDPTLDHWCAVNCPTGLCPPVYCTCSSSSPKPALTVQTPRPLPPQTPRPLPPHTSQPLAPRTRYSQTVLKPTSQSPVVSHHTPRPVGPAGYPPTHTNRAPHTTNTYHHSSGQMAKTGVCHGVHLWQGNAVLDQWCTVNCARGLCPPMYCDCSGSFPAFSWPTTKLAPPVFKTTTTKPNLPQTPRNTPPLVPVKTQGTSLASKQTIQPSRTNMQPFILTKTSTQSQMTSPSRSQGGPCRAINNLQGIPKYDKFCNDVCNSSSSGSTCPPLLCECNTRP